MEGEKPERREKVKLKLDKYECAMCGFGSDSEEAFANHEASKVHRLISTLRKDEKLVNKTPLSLLNEFAMRNKVDITYKTVDEGPSPLGMPAGPFEIHASLGGGYNNVPQVRGVGLAKQKARAKQMCAADALEQLMVTVPESEFTKPGQSKLRFYGRGDGRGWGPWPNARGGARVGGRWGGGFRPGPGRSGPYVPGGPGGVGAPAPSLPRPLPPPVGPTSYGAPGAWQYATRSGPGYPGGGYDAVLSQAHGAGGIGAGVSGYPGAPAGAAGYPGPAAYGGMKRPLEADAGGHGSMPAGGAAAAQRLRVDPYQGAGFAAGVSAGGPYPGPGAGTGGTPYGAAYLTPQQQQQLQMAASVVPGGGYTSSQYADPSTAGASAYGAVYGASASQYAQYQQQYQQQQQQYAGHLGQSQYAYGQPRAGAAGGEQAQVAAGAAPQHGQAAQPGSGASAGKTSYGGAYAGYDYYNHYQQQAQA